MSEHGDWPGDVLDFWFEEIGAEGWWRQAPETDAEIARRFGALWEKQCKRSADDFLATPRVALAAVVLFDQFSRNLFRGTAKAYAADLIARNIAAAAIAKGYEEDFGEAERMFLYMPFMHSEALADQDRALDLFATLDDPGPLEFARKHHAIIAEHGRFPHRNDALGRETLPAEKGAVEKGADW